MFIVSAFLITSGIFGIKAESIKEYNTMIENGQYDQCIDFIKYYKLTIFKKYNANDTKFMSLSQKYNDLKNQCIIK